MKIRLSNKQLQYLTLGLCVLWMAVIFCFSATPADSSSQQSGGLASLISGFFGGEMSTAGMNALEVALRKAAHIAEFGVLGGLWYGYFYVSRVNKFKPATASAVVSVLYAVSDEVHQYFVPGRAARWYDVLIDSLGVVLGILVTIYFLRRYKKWKQK